MANPTETNQITLQGINTNEDRRQIILIRLVLHAFPFRITRCNCCHNQEDRQNTFNHLLIQFQNHHQ